jgi:hypothetical protein
MALRLEGDVVFASAFAEAFAQVGHAALGRFFLFRVVAYVVRDPSPSFGRERAG